jgi:hypothetical protein
VNGAELPAASPRSRRSANSWNVSTRFRQSQIAVTAPVVAVSSPGENSDGPFSKPLGALAPQDDPTSKAPRAGTRVT